MKTRGIRLEFVERDSPTSLVGALQSLFADTFVFYLRAHGYHWNVEGRDFGPFHTLFGSIAEEVYGTVDDMAEHVRKLGAYTPYTFALFDQARTIADKRLSNSSPLPMVHDLLDANQQLLERIAVCKQLAVDAKEDNLGNYLDDRRDAHQKHAWFLRATAVPESR